MSRTIHGWKSITAALAVEDECPHVNTVQRWARRNVDPLPIIIDHLGVSVDSAALAAWVERQRRPLRFEDELRRLRAEKGIER